MTVYVFMRNLRTGEYVYMWSGDAAREDAIVEMANHGARLVGPADHEWIAF